MKNCGTCGAPVADSVEKCFKCGALIANAGGGGPELMQKFGRGRTVHRVATGLDKRKQASRKKPARAAAGKKRRAAKDGDASTEAQQLALVAGGSEGDIAARILRDLIDEGAIGDEKRKSAEKLVGELGGSLPPPRKKVAPKKRPRKATASGVAAAAPTPDIADAGSPAKVSDSKDTGSTASAAPEEAAAPGPEVKLARLKELSELSEAGVITADEFQLLKKQIIG